MAEVDGNLSQPMSKELPAGFGDGVSEEQAQELKRLLEEIEMYENVCLPELCHSWLDFFGFKRFILRIDQPIFDLRPSQKPARASKAKTTPPCFFFALFLVELEFINFVDLCLCKCGRDWLAHH